jgi:uncharacterized protein (DUF433 family)
VATVAHSFGGIGLSRGRVKLWQLAGRFPLLSEDAEFPTYRVFLMNYRNHITIEANKRGGKPCVRGLRITVYEVLEYLASEMTEAEILDDFPDLTREDLKACIAYAADRERRFMTATLSA